MTAIARRSGLIRVLLTVPHLESTASPYKEMMALARHLPRDEFSLTICSLRENGWDETAPELRALGARVFVARFRPRGKTLGHFVSCLRDQSCLTNAGPFDVQHSMDFTSSPIEGLLARLARRRFVFTQRNLNVGGDARLLRIKGMSAVRVVALSQAVREFLEDLGVRGKKLVVIELGLEQRGDPGPVSGLPITGPFVLSVGHLIRLKRHEDAIEALSRISATVSDVSLLIAGAPYDAEYAAELRELVAKRRLEDRVHFLGPRQDVPALMRRAVCLLHTSETEAAPWVLLEAMAEGLPIVASSVGGIPEMIDEGKTGLLVEAGDVESFAASLRRILTDATLARSLSTAARQTVLTRFSASGMANRIAALYRQLCA